MNTPHGGTLVNRIATGARKDQLEAKAKTIFNLTIEDRYGADIEMIAVGAFSPITGFMGKADCESAIESMTLTNGLAWGIPDRKSTRLNSSHLRLSRMPSSA